MPGRYVADNYRKCTGVVRRLEGQPTESVTNESLEVVTFFAI